MIARTLIFLGSTFLATICAGQESASQVQAKPIDSLEKIATPVIVPQSTQVLRVSTQAEALVPARFIDEGKVLQPESKELLSILRQIPGRKAVAHDAKPRSGTHTDGPSQSVRDAMSAKVAKIAQEAADEPKK